jgi:hypothetical protein
MSHTQAVTQGAEPYTDVTGKSYTLKLIDQEVKKEFAYRQYKAAQDRARDLCKRDESVDLDEKLSALEHHYMMGHFGLLSPDGVVWMKSPAGQFMMFSICTGCDEDEAQLVCLGDPEGVAKVMQSVLGHSFPGLEDRWDAKKKKVAGAPK